MEARFDKIEQRLAALERDVAAMRANYATKDDIVGVYKAINTQTWKLVTFVCGFGTALVAATFFIASQFR